MSVPFEQAMKDSGIAAQDLQVTLIGALAMIRDELPNFDKKQVEELMKSQMGSNMIMVYAQEYLKRQAAIFAQYQGDEQFRATMQQQMAAIMESVPAKK